MARCLTSPADAGEVTTPMFALRPLLAKEANDHVAETRRRLTLRSFAVSAAWARPVRDAIRTLLREHACGGDLRRAGAAVQLLGYALHQPAGMYGRSVSHEEVLSWENDDIATITVLREAAQETASPVIRRLIRHEIAWTAEHAASLPLRHAALTLVTGLDEHDDDLAELLLHHRSAGEPTRRGIPVPTLDELQATEDARAERESGCPEEQREAERAARIRARVESRRSLHNDLVRRVVDELTASAEPADIVAALDRTCREIRSAVPAQYLTLWDVWHQLGLIRPDLVPGIVHAIAAGETGPLDDNLDQLLRTWAEHDEPALIDWPHSVEEQRLAVRLSVGTAFVNYGWTDRGSPFIALYRRGTQDPAPQVRDQFLMGSSRLLVADPAGTVPDLLAGSISYSAATRVLEQACHHDGSSWVLQLDERDAGAVLDLVRHAGWEDYSVQQIVSDIARVHPRLVLEDLVAAHRTGELPTDVHGLGAPFDDHAEAMVDWMVEQSQRGDVDEAAAVVGLVMDGGLTAAQAERLHAAVDSMDGSGLLALTASLGNVHTWPLRQPELARRFLSKARELGSDTAVGVRAEIAAGMHLGMWGFTNGESSELESARAAATACAEVETDSELREDFEAARARFEGTVEWLRRRNAEDDEEDED